jgi:hypothetical protein
MESFSHSCVSILMLMNPHLHGSVSHVEKLTDFLVLFPILLLRRLLGAVLDHGLALAATFKHSMSLAGEAAGLGHDSDAMGYVDVMEQWCVATLRAAVMYVQLIEIP